jgi:hypothetical protein
MIAQAAIKRLMMQRLWDHGMRDARHATARRQRSKWFTNDLVGLVVWMKAHMGEVWAMN